MTTDRSPQRARVSVSTWSLHRTLGDPQIYGADNGEGIPTATHGRGALSLLEVPAQLAAFGIHTLEICHFHLPRLDAGYFREVRSALHDAHVELFSLLLDEGDITHSEHATRDLAWISSWLDVASALGATRMPSWSGWKETSASVAISGTGAVQTNTVTSNPSPPLPSRVMRKPFLLPRVTWSRTITAAVSISPVRQDSPVLTP